MILTRCPGDRAVAARAIAAASDAVAENAKYTQRQRLPSIRATMRSVRQRAGGMLKNAAVVRLSSVRAATSQRPDSAAILLNHSVRRPPAATRPGQSLKKR